MLVLEMQPIWQVWVSPRPMNRNCRGVGAGTLVLTSRTRWSIVQPRLGSVGAGRAARRRPEAGSVQHWERWERQSRVGIMLRKWEGSVLI